jgi:3-oxoacyl-[acyl-carrier protein] reductase
MTSHAGPSQMGEPEVVESRVALVGGASSGLGAAVSYALAAAGFNVALGARREEIVTERAATLAKTFGVKALGIRLDISDSASVADAVRQTTDSLQRVDVLVLNGGGPPPGDAASLDAETARSAAELLLYGHLGLIAATLPAMRQRGWGRIVAIGSSAVQQPIPGLTTSSMFRAALASYLKLLAAEVAAEGITVNMVVPGRIHTERVDELDRLRAVRTSTDFDEVQRTSRASIPAGRYGTPDELAAVVTFLAGPAASYVTGEQIRVDGGLIGAL